MIKKIINKKSLVGETMKCDHSVSYCSVQVLGCLKNAFRSLFKLTSLHFVSSGEAVLGAHISV